MGREPRNSTGGVRDRALRSAVGRQSSYLLGLKENIIIGHLIPAGTGLYRYHDVETEPPEGFQPPARPPAAMPLPGALVEEVEAGP